MTINVTIVPILDNNYAYIIYDTQTAVTGVIDPGEAKPVMDALKQQDLHLDWVINTHHHWDHTDGNRPLIDRYKARWAAPAECGDADIILTESELFYFGDTPFEILWTPGHTAGHICLFSREDGLLFSGDTLFSMGCGRLFEGTAEDMFMGMRKIKSLPLQTQIYCGHEYTLSNGEFAAHLMPDNTDIQTRLRQVRALRADNISTIPVTLETELKTNPFLMATSAEELGRYRAQKDKF